MIRHSVAFTLHHERGSAAEADFLAAADVLATIPGVERFEKLRETSPKNGFDYAFAFFFDTPEAYAAYNSHPAHVEFVETRWVPEVSDFLEIDTEPLA